MNSHVLTENIKTSSVNSPKNPQHEGTKRMTIFSDWDNGPIQKINLEIKLQRNEFLGNY